MDEETSRLCVHVVQIHFGPLTAGLASLLTSRGRLQVPQLLRLSGLKSRTARAALLILIQHHLVRHFESDDDGETVEFDADACLMRLRFGRYSCIASDLLSKEAAEIVDCILDHGQLRAQDVISVLGISEAKAKKLYMLAFHRLVNGLFLLASTRLSHLSPLDRLLKFEEDERSKLKGIPTAKQLREVQEMAQARFDAEQNDLLKMGLTKDKPAATAKAQTKKKSSGNDILDDRLCYRVNFAKFNLHIRNELFVRFAQGRYNDGAASVLRAALIVSETKEYDLSSIRSEAITLNSLSTHLTQSDQLRSGLLRASSQNNSTTSLIKEYIGHLSCADNVSSSGRVSRFVSTTSSTSGTIQIEHDLICRQLRLQVLEDIVNDRHGEDAVRIFRILLDTGKMDEKHLSKVAMMAHKELRPLLSRLSAESLVSLSEVPKGNDRNPTRTFYLWYVDLPRAYTSMSQTLCKTLFNVLARKEAESAAPLVRSLLEKCAREDVANDENLLSYSEKALLQTCRSMRDKLSVLSDRLEEALFVLRELRVHSPEDYTSAL